MYVYLVLRDSKGNPNYVEQHICSEACHICWRRFECYTQEWVKLRSNGKPGVVFERNNMPYGFLCEYCGVLTGNKFDKIVGRLLATRLAS